MKCIKCGTELAAIMGGNAQFVFPVGYQCPNPECSEFEKPWSVAEHKDNQDWAVRHIRALEAKYQYIIDEMTKVTQHASSHKK